MMIKSETISQIMQLNPSVGATFLSEFSNEQLVRYLKRLRDLSDSTPRHGQAKPMTSPPFLRADALQSA